MSTRIYAWASEPNHEGGCLSIDIIVRARSIDAEISAAFAQGEDEDDVIDRLSDKIAAFFETGCRACVSVDLGNDAADDDVSTWVYINLSLFANVHSGLRRVQAAYPDVMYEINGLNAVARQSVVIGGPDPLIYGLQEERVESLASDSLRFFTL